MARKVGLREFQIQVAERLRTAATRKTLSSKLGFQIGSSNWFVALEQVSEVIPVPQPMAVPLTQPWFRGVANVRGKRSMKERLAVWSSASVTGLSSIFDTSSVTMPMAYGTVRDLVWKLAEKVSG